MLKCDQVVQQRGGSSDLLMSFITSGSCNVNAVIKFTPFLSFTNSEQIKSPKISLRILQFCNCFPECSLLSFPWSKGHTNSLGTVLESSAVFLHCSAVINLKHSEEH